MEDELPPLAAPDASDAERAAAIEARFAARYGAPTLAEYRRAYRGFGAHWPGDDEIRRTHVVRTGLGAMTDDTPALRSLHNTVTLYGLTLDRIAEHFGVTPATDEDIAAELDRDRQDAADAQAAYAEHLRSGDQPVPLSRALSGPPQPFLATEQSSAPELIITREEFARWYAEVIARVQTDGVTYTITDHGEPLAHLRPPHHAAEPVVQPPVPD